MAGARERPRNIGRSGKIIPERLPKSVGSCGIVRMFQQTACGSPCVQWRFGNPRSYQKIIRFRRCLQFVQCRLCQKQVRISRKAVVESSFGPLDLNKLLRHPQKGDLLLPAADWQQ